MATTARFPPWLRKRIPPEARLRRVRDLLARLRLHTVCQSAHCPNLCECFAQGTATFMILGNTCTRNCRFCAVETGTQCPPEPDEPERVAEAAATLGLRHVVVTSVTRDDLEDEGSSHFARTIQAIRAVSDATVEVLTPDFQGRRDCIERVLQAHPDVLNHNVETVPRLYPLVRPQADYRRSLDFIRQVADWTHTCVVAKSGLMVGLGETRDEILQAFRDLRDAGAQAITVGQYLRPSPEHLPVQRFVTPDEFNSYREAAEAMGFAAVAAGPFVRSSYHAGALLGEISVASRS